MNLKKKVCIFTSVHSWNDVRIYHKQAMSLSAFYDVELHAVADFNYKDVKGIKIYGLPRYSERGRRPLLWWLLLKRAIKSHADVYHFHDPELIPVGLLIKLLTRKPVIYDVHEDYPAAILSKEWIPAYMRGFIAWVFSIFEKGAALILDRIVAATPDIGRKFPLKKTVLLRNLPIISLIDGIEDAAVYKQKPAVIYAGGLMRIRGIKEIIEAMDILNGKVELWLFGEWDDEEYRQKCMSLNGWKYVKYFGFKPVQDVYRYMKHADIGLSVLYPVPNYLNSLPVKAFEYMACGLPMLMSDFNYWKEVFGKCAIFVNPYDPLTIADGIQYLLSDTNMSRQLGLNGRELVSSEYSWEAESNKLFEMYRQITEP